MENFAFYYSLLTYISQVLDKEGKKESSVIEEKIFKFSLESLEENNEWTKKFFAIAKNICWLESQTFLTNESKAALIKERQNLEKLISQYELVSFENPKFKHFQKNINFLKIKKNDRRILLAFMCTFLEWCENIQFQFLTLDQKKEALQENPLLAMRMILPSH